MDTVPLTAEERLAIREHFEAWYLHMDLERVQEGLTLTDAGEYLFKDPQRSWEGFQEGVRACLKLHIGQ